MGKVGEDDEDITALILSHACRNCHILSIINSMWSARYSNQSALFILSYQELVTYTLIIDLSVFTSDSALSFPVICVKSYIGSRGVLVPTGTVHSNNEFEFEFEFILYIYIAM